MSRSTSPHAQRRRSKGALRAGLLGASLLLTACGGSTASRSPTTPEPRTASVVHDVEILPAVQAAVDATDRTEEDRALDAGRHPAELFSFFGVQPGWHVVDVFAGGGHSTELLARIVGPSGSVVAQNNAWVLDRFARAPLEQRLERLAMPNVTALQAELDAPMPPGAHDLDAVIFILSYHDSVWMNADRAAMNRAIFEALRPGGVYGIVDHAAAAGHGTADAQTLHRIERSVVVDEVLAAGFVLDAEADLLASPDDAHDWNASPREAGERRGTSDRFVLRFRRP
jgi:predicted methyltransferase